MIDRIPPQNLDAERAVIGGLFLVPDGIDQIAAQLPVEHFYNDAHQSLYATLLELWREGVKAIDAVVVAERLGPRLEEVGGLPYLSQILEAVPHASHTRYYANIVSDKFYRRSLIYALSPALREAYEDQQRPVTEMCIDLASALQRLGGDSQTGQDISVSAAMFERIKELEQGRLWISSGLPRLDSRLGGGFEETHLVVLAGRPGHGKSAAAGNIGIRAAKQGHGVHIVTREMRRTEYVERQLSQVSGVNGLRIRRNELDEAEGSKVTVAHNTLASLPITIDDRNRSMSRIMAETFRQVNRGAKLVIVDYLQIITPRDESQNRERQIATMTREFKDMAMSTGCVVLLLSQINREVEKRQGRGSTAVPQLSDLRESGAIEQDANVVLFTHLPFKIEKGKPRDRGLFIIAKQRSGDCSAIEVAWDGPTTTFADVPLTEF